MQKPPTGRVSARIPRVPCASEAEKRRRRSYLSEDVGAFSTLSPKRMHLCMNREAWALLDIQNRRARYVGTTCILTPRGQQRAFTGDFSHGAMISTIRVRPVLACNSRFLVVTNWLISCESLTIADNFCVDIIL